MRRGISIAILALAVLVPSAGRAAEATLAVEGSVQYDTNVFSTPTNLVNDVSLRPAVEVGMKADPTSDFQWSVMYRPDYEAYVDTHGINGFNHLARADADYHLSGATDVFFHEQFQRVLNLVDRAQTLQADQAGLGQPALIFGREAVTLNDLQAGVTHNLSPRLQTTLTLSNSLYYPTATNVSDASTSGVTGDLIYALTHTDRIGSSLGFTYQALTATDFQPRTSTRYYQLMGIWVHDFSPTFQVDMRAGPAWVDPSNLTLTPQTTEVQTVPTATFGNQTFPLDVNSCPKKGGQILFANGCTVLPNSLSQAQLDFANAAFSAPPIPGDTGGTNGGLTYFAAINLVKHWERLDGSLTYQRTTGASSSFNQSTILDTVQGRLGWRPSELWNMTLSASWSRRTAASDQPLLVEVLQPLGPGQPAGDPIDPNAAKAAGVTTVKFSNAVDVDTWIAYLRVDRKISRRASVFGLLMFVNQIDNSGFASLENFTDYRAQVGFRYEFDPLPLAL